MSWLEKFPGTPRPVQKELIEQLEANWEKYDIFIVSAPTGLGKSFIAKCLMSQLYDVAYLAPTNILVNQFLEHFPESATLQRMASYWCSTWQRPCVATRARLLTFCKRDLNCPGCEDIKRNIIQAKYRKEPLVCNYHIYNGHKIQRDTLILDEAHNLLQIIKSFLSITLWQHDFKYPEDMHSYDYMTKWVTKLPPHIRKYKKIKLLEDALISLKPAWIAHRSEGWFNGKGTKRGESELRDCIELSPVDISTEDTPKYFWGGAKPPSKLVLLSATIGPKDVEELGLYRFSRKILYLECSSPIPAVQRPVIWTDTVAVTRGNVVEATELLTRDIFAIAADRPDTKGVVHATYQLAKLLKAKIQDRRFLFHTAEDKKQVYAQFLASKEPVVLVASGMYEGIDLPEDLGRWQVVAKIPWPSLGNKAIKYKAEKDEEWYYWETLKVVIQACGRISRSEKDFGETFILDSTWKKLYTECQRLKLIPGWFQEALEVEYV